MESIEVLSLPPPPTWGMKALNPRLYTVNERSLKVCLGQGIVGPNKLKWWTFVVGNLLFQISSDFTTLEINF